jgi:hypothetical protein
MYEEDTVYKDLAVITRIIWKLWRCVRYQWLMPLILTTQGVDIRMIVVQEVDIRMIVVQSQAG